MQSEDNLQRFEVFWPTGPWQKRDKINARKRFNKSVKTAEDWRLIQCARDEYGAYCRQNAWYTPMFGGTFMSKWRDWLKPGNPEVTFAAPTLYRMNDGIQAIEDALLHDTTHVCDLCIEAHEWTCTDELCTLEKTVPCKAWLAAHRARTGRG